MQVVELINETLDSEIADQFKEALRIFADLNHLTVETELEQVILNNNDALRPSEIIESVRDVINDNLYYVLREMGIEPIADNPPSMDVSSIIIRTLMSVTELENTDGVYDLIEARDDNVVGLVRLVDRYGEEFTSGNAYGLYEELDQVDDSLYRNLMQLLEGTRESLFAGAPKAIEGKVTHEGFIHDWVKDSERTGYNFDAAFTLHAEALADLVGESRPTDLELGEVISNLKVLLHFSSLEYKDEWIDEKLEDLFPNDPTIIARATALVPYVNVVEYDNE